MRYCNGATMLIDSNIVLDVHKAPKIAMKKKEKKTNFFPNRFCFCVYESIKYAKQLKHESFFISSRRERVIRNFALVMNSRENHSRRSNRLKNDLVIRD